MKRKGPVIEEKSIKMRLIEAGKTLFAEHGFAGTSVREICKAADASSTMIHHYFGSKTGLYEAIIQEFSSRAFDVPLRLIDSAPKTREEFLLRLEMFISETFRALIAQEPVFRILRRENSGFVGLEHFHKGFGAFLKAAQDAGHIDKRLRVDLVTGLVLDRLGNQVLFAATTKGDGPNVLTDEAYAKEWLEANTVALSFGLGMPQGDVQPSKE